MHHGQIIRSLRYELAASLCQMIQAILLYLVVVLDVQAVSGISKARSLVEVPKVAPEIGIVHDTLLVALLEQKEEVVLVNPCE